MEISWAYLLNLPWPVVSLMSSNIYFFEHDAHKQHQKQTDPTTLISHAHMHYTDAKHM